MRLMIRIETAVLCLLVVTAACDTATVEQRLNAIEKDAEAAYARSQIETRATHDIQTLLEKTDDDLRTLGFHHPEVLRTIYQGRGNRPLWLEGSSLNGKGATITTVTDDAVLSHGVDPKRVHQSTRFELLKRAEPAPYTLDLTASERTHLKGMLEMRPASKDDEFTTLLVGSSSPLDRIRESLKFNATRMASASRLETLTTDALVEYGMEMRWSHDVWTKNTTWPDHLKAPKNEDGEEDLTRQLKQKRRNHVAINALRNLVTAEDLSGELADLVPTYEQYKRLTKAYQTYRKIVAEGGWDELPKSAVKLSIGDVDPAVRTLKRRLAAEGYWKGDDGPFFTEPLRDALKAYQKTHQLWEKGTVSRETILSLNVPAERRLSQIRVALDRWRASNIGDADTYVLVNIPDFHLEFWRDGVREQRFKTVVGATAMTTDDESGERSYGFATPRVSSEISSIVFDPYWWVPPGIETNELVPTMIDDPNYAERLGYEWADNHHGERVLRQKPGERNALGRVKLLFDNEHHIYLHDTPERHLFGWPVRAESHGCVRLERAMSLAHALLTREAKWKAEYDHRTSTERVINLEKPVPIHVEYYVVRVDDHGRTNFFADLYRLNYHRYKRAANMEIGQAIPASVIAP